MAHLNPETPQSPKTCRECNIEKKITEFRKYSKGNQSDPLCLPCRKVIEKQKRYDKKINPVPRKYPIEPTARRGRPKKIVVEEVKEVVVEEVKEEVVEEEDVADADKEFRTCEVCGESKELNSDFFHKQVKGFGPKCKDCKNKLRREQYKNNDQYRANKMNYQRSYQPEYYTNNKDKFKEYQKRYMEKIKKQLKEEADKLKKQEKVQKPIKEESLNF